ncbi:hypothetical protein ACW9IK_27410 [Pseudomonas gingeri]|uniref:Uncharacterized protein n=1 Tax=Pseudomonas gingeri TaxID=117681 RepID=A0A7Y7Y1H2_9PSED|nr:hypothetical protein [Pseudomonas gingeri]NWC16179.1 hypothetical protein [Pseudomonas gingeri]
MPNRPADIRSRRFPWNIDYTSVCDLCGRWRTQGSHVKCSRRRQVMNAHLRTPQPK